MNTKKWSLFYDYLVSTLDGLAICVWSASYPFKALTNTT